MKRRVCCILLLAAALLCAGAAAETAAAVRGCPMLSNAFTVLEEGNPFIERYNRITGENVRARMSHGAPYFWGAQQDHLFAKEPEYVVLPAWQNSPAYYRAGTKYLYGFDCVGFVKWVWKETYGQAMPARADLLRDRGNQVRCTAAGEGPIWEGFAETLIPGDLLLMEHRSGGHHVAIYIGTLRMYGYSEGEAPELAGELDGPLVIHCTTNAQVADRFADLIQNGLPKYKCATPPDGGVCVSLLAPTPDKAPSKVHQQNQDTWYYTLPDGTWLTVLRCDDITEYAWYRIPLDPKRRQSAGSAGSAAAPGAP